jgi:hypothetical protein
MALPQKGTRRITVDGKLYRWVLRKKPTYCQGAFASPMTFAVESADCPKRTLVVTTTVARPDNWLHARSLPVTPLETLLRPYVGHIAPGGNQGRADQLL